MIFPGIVLRQEYGAVVVLFLMRAILKAYNDTTRKIWVADSFEGLPPPDPKAYPADARSNFHTIPYLSVPLEKVQENFKKI